MSHRGSLEFWPHRRAHKLLPRVRNWPASTEPTMTSLVAFKAGMTHVSLVDDSQSPSKGQEITRAATIMVFPKIFVYGARLYGRKYLYSQAAGAVLDKTLAQKLGMKNTPKSLSLEDVKKRAGEFTEATVLAFADPGSLGIGIKKMLRFEFPVGGKDIATKLAFIEKHLGKEIKPGEFLGAGEYVDIISITKGKGWEGPVHRFHVARQYHKSTGKIRHVGTLGAWHPPKVLFSVPMAGHLGFNYRTELNKRILKVGSQQEAGAVTPKGGFMHFGELSNDYLIVDGSIPGPAKRLVRIRKAMRSARKPVAPKLTYISVSSKQGA